MSEILPSLRSEVLPPNCTITIQGVETHAIQEAILDSSYRILAYDADLQSPEVRTRYAAFTPVHMATLTLRAMGLDWRTTKAALTDEAGNHPDLDDRLADDLFAGRAIGYCCRQGLIRAEVLSGRHDVTDELDPIHLTNDQVEALSLLARGAINHRNHRAYTTLRVLGELRGKESSLLALLVKSSASDLNLHPPTDIVYRRSHVADRIKKPSAEPSIEPPEENLRLAPQINSKLLEQSKAFCNDLRREADTWATQEAPVILWKNTAFTFRLTDFTPDQRKAIVYATFGVPLSMIGKTARRSDEIVHNMRHKFDGLPKTKALWGLFLLSKNYLVYDRPVDLDDNPYEPNLQLLQYNVIRGIRHQRSIIPKPETEEARTYIFNQIGVASLSEALLALGTHGLVHMPVTEYGDIVVTLTPREQQILAFLIQGLSAATICTKLSIAEESVEKHTNNIFRKLGVSSRTEAAAKFYENKSLKVGLPPRQKEIALLLGKGLSNKAIAAELNLTIAQVKRRVRHILRKAGAKSRLEALARLFDLSDRRTTL